MEPTQNKYPIFEANQVLSNSHLNQIFDYLDEQERLTRANLIGIGIVCGWEIRFDPAEAVATIHLSKGCGVTSEGYLIVEPEDLTLVSYRDYNLPSDLDYSPFKDKSAENKPQYPLWEMFPAGEPDTTPLGAPSNFLNDKAVVLFLELKKEGLRNCSPNECNDRGSEVTATLRRLLIGRTDLEKIIAEANALATDLTSTDLETALSARLNLPDLRLPRYDAPNTGPATTYEVLAAFHAVFHPINLAQSIGDALTVAYDAFKPVVQETYPFNPFASFSANFGFLDDAPTETAQVLFLQYYYDFFDDIIKAYDEFRWKGVELMCACCPPEGLFPRHLMVGVLFPTAVTNPGVYRHHFLLSPAIGGCEERTKELKLLFQRLVEMIAVFTNDPLPKSSSTSKTDEQIRITPSQLGDGPLSDKAIPYYYLQDSTPPLYHLWNAEKNRRNRANQNLSYRSDEYTPTAPAFVTNALRYDLEPYNFLRIEGHLGKNYRNVLETLLTLKTDYRLPIEVLALRTGAFDENIPVDLSKETCRFQDLEALYDALREELLSTLCEGVMYFYDIPIAGSELAGGAPKLSLLKKYAPNYRHKNGTVGAWYEKYLALLQSKPYIDVDQDKIDSNAVLTVYCFLFTGTTDLPPENFAHVVSIYYLTKLAEVLPSSLDALGYADFENKYQDLLGLIRYFRSDAKNTISGEFEKFTPQEDLIDHFDQVLFSCKLEPVKAIHEEYVRRLREVKQKQFLSLFLQKNPGIQHKAGVPLGGTFIIVYHEEPAPLRQDLDIDEIKDSINPTTRASSKANIDKVAVSKAFKRLSTKQQYAQDADIVYLLGAFTGQVSALSKPARVGEAVDKIIAETVSGLDDGTVICDFFLPYLCCSDNAPIQYVLPAPPLGLTVELGCTDPNTSTAEATLTPQGGMAPFTYQLDSQPFRALTGKVLLAAGPHTLVIRDSAGAESAPQSLEVPGPLSIGAENYTDFVSEQDYTVSFPVSGGTLPYASDSGTFTVNNTFTSKPEKSGETISVTITDSVGCEVSRDFTHSVEKPCKLPCDGLTVRCGYRFWLPEPEPNRPYKSFGVEVPAFMFELTEGATVDLAEDVAAILNQASPDALNSDFNDVVRSWMKEINAVIANKAGTEDWLRLEYDKLPTDSIGTIWIEHFECLKFEFHIQTFFQRPEISEQLDMVYTPEGTTILNLQTKIPAFNCIQVNKCDPNLLRLDLCEAVDLALKINKRVGRRGVTLSVEASGNDQPVAFLWEVQDGIPALSNEKEANFTFERREPLTKIIRLTAYTEKGCSVIGIDKIDLG